MRSAFISDRPEFEPQPWRGIEYLRAITAWLPEKRHFSGPNCVTNPGWRFPSSRTVLRGKNWAGPSDLPNAVVDRINRRTMGPNCQLTARQRNVTSEIKFQSAAEPGFVNGIKPYKARPPHASPSDNCEACKIRSGRRKWLNGSLAGKGAMMAADSN